MLIETDFSNFRYSTVSCVCNATKLNITTSVGKATMKLWFTPPAIGG